MTSQLILFWLFAILTCGGAVFVALSQNVVRMAFSLVLTLGSTAVLFLLLGADFVGATQLLVYVGGTLVLLVFGVMLTATGPFVRIKNSPADIIVSGLIGVVFLFLISSTVRRVDWELVDQRIAVGSNSPAVRSHFNPKEQGNTTRPLGLSFLSLRPDQDLRAASLAEPSKSNGSVRLSAGYLLPFEIVSVHLLVVLIGAAYLARTKRRVSRQN